MCLQTVSCCISSVIAKMKYWLAPVGAGETELSKLLSNLLENCQF